MAKYNFFLSYSRKDGLDVALALRERLIAKGYTVFSINEMNASDDLDSQLQSAIANSDCFIPIITDEYLNSEWAYMELAHAVALSESRAKTIIPLLCTDKPLPKSLPIYHLSHYNATTMLGFDKSIEQIDAICGNKLKSKNLYEKLAELRAIKNSNGEALTLSELIDLTHEKWCGIPDYALKDKQDTCNELVRLFEELSKYVGEYSDEGRRIVHVILNSIDKISRLISANSNEPEKNLFRSSLYFAAAALRLIWLDREIRSECADVITYGDVRDPCPIANYIQNQKPFLECFNALKTESAMASLSPKERDFIEQSANYVLTPIRSSVKAGRQIVKEEVTEDDRILISIAKFIEEGNKLFDALQQKGMAGDFLTCLLTSYERLKSYCEIVGAKSVATACIDRIIEIRNAIDKADDSAVSNQKAEDGIKSLLGFTLKNSGSYDVFISFKSEDADLAEKIYDFAQRNLKVPFWSKRTLPQLSKSEYEDAIYSALRSSKHFVVVLSKLEYLNANWIKREMASFDRAITEGRKKDSNFVFVVTDDVYKEIIASNKMCLDERYCGYQIIKLSEYEETLLQYIV